VSFSKEGVFHTASYIHLTGLIRPENRKTSGIFVCVIAFGCAHLSADCYFSSDWHLETTVHYLHRMHKILKL